MATIFSRIVAGEIPARVVAETEDYLAFLDVRPMVTGHTLCIPKREVDYYFDLEDAEMAGLTLFAKRVARAVEAVVPCERIATMVLGLEVPHAHLHLLPVRNERDFWQRPGTDLDDAGLDKLAEQIAAAYEG